ncbi:MAG: DUF6531 domain-containing protein, partial [Woeseiaceae bacterium]|nr:DUF6531 domain-containing protein [Woeseiaceae bacterium]
MNGVRARLPRNARIFLLVGLLIAGLSLATSNRAEAHPHDFGFWHTHVGGGVSAFDWCTGPASCEAVVQTVSIAPEITDPWQVTYCDQNECEAEIVSCDFDGWPCDVVFRFHADSCTDGQGNYGICPAYEYYVEPQAAPEVVCNESNPCNPIDGNKRQSEIDFAPTAEGAPGFVRIYNSLGSYRSSGDLGAGWRHNYSRALDEEPDKYPTGRFMVLASMSRSYQTPSDACSQGWDDVKANVWKGELSSTTATFAGGDVCKITSGGDTVAYMPVRASGGWTGFAGPTTVHTVSRPDGRVYRFELVGANWESVLDGSVSLEAAGSNWVFTDENDTRETFDASGRLISIEYRSGQTETLEYDLTAAQGGDDNPATLDRVTGEFGHELVFAYDASGRLSTVTTPDGDISFAYDSASNLTSTTYPDATIRQYKYEDSRFASHLTGIVDENGATYANWAYDTRGRAILSEHAGGKERVEFAYNSDGTTTLTRGDGASRTFDFGVEQGRQRVTTVSGDVCGDCPGGSTKSASYDANGYLSERTDWNNVVTKLARNNRGLVETLTEAYGTSDARVTTIQWAANDRIPTQVTTPKNVTDYVYDIDGNLTSLTVSSGSLSRAWALTYNADGQPLTIDGPRTDVTDVTTLEYYDCATGSECGQLKKITNAVGHATTFDAYDGAGRPTSMTDPNGLTTTI